MPDVARRTGPARARLQAALAAIADKEGQVGWLASAKYPDGTQVAYVAAIQEFGSAPQGIPPRMGLREMVEKKRDEWSKVAQYGAKQILDGAASGDDMLTLIGGVAEADIRKQIASVTEPPLKPATIEARRNASASKETRTATGAKPLVDTGLMLATVTHAVVAKGSSK